MVVCMASRTCAVKPAASAGWLMGSMWSSLMVGIVSGKTIASVVSSLFGVIRYPTVPVSLTDRRSTRKGGSGACLSGSGSGSSEMNTVMMNLLRRVSAVFLVCDAQLVKVMCLWRARAFLRRSSRVWTALRMRGLLLAACLVTSMCEICGMVIRLPLEPWYDLRGRVFW